MTAIRKASVGGLIAILLLATCPVACRASDEAATLRAKLQTYVELGREMVQAFTATNYVNSRDGTEETHAPIAG